MVYTVRSALTAPMMESVATGSVAEMSAPKRYESNGVEKSSTSVLRLAEAKVPGTPVAKMVWPITKVVSSVPTTAKRPIVPMLPKKTRLESEKPASKMIGGSSTYRKSSSSKTEKDSKRSFGDVSAPLSRSSPPSTVPTTIATADAGSFLLSAHTAEMTSSTRTYESTITSSPIAACSPPSIASANISLAVCARRRGRKRRASSRMVTSS